MTAPKETKSEGALPEGETPDEVDTFCRIPVTQGQTVHEEWRKFSKKLLRERDAARAERDAALAEIQRLKAAKEQQ